MADADGVCERAVIYYDDGTACECETTPALAAAIRRMEWADAKADRRRRKREKNATDLKQQPNWWEGPRFDFVLLVGESSIWSGPASLWLTPDGSPVAPGHEPEDGADGRCRPRRHHPVVCRFCGGAGPMSPGAACLNPGCSRTGRDKTIGKGERRALIKQVAPAAPGLKGGTG